MQNVITSSLSVPRAIMKDAGVAAPDCSLVFDDVGRSVNLVGCPELQPAFSGLVRGWSCRSQPHLVETPDMVFSRVGKKYDWEIAAENLTAADRGGKPTDAVMALGDFHYELGDWYCEAFPRQLCLHAAGCVFGAGGVLFPSVSEAGKSVLTMALAAAGHKVLGDDVVAFDTESGELVSPGLLPRMRLPLPAKAMGKNLTAFVEARQWLLGKYEVYVALEAGRLAELGERCSAAGVVVLNRSKTYVPAQLTRISRPDALRSLIGQNYNTSLPVETIYAALKAIVLPGRNFKLTYSDPNDAVAVLEKEFGHAVK